MPSSSSTTPEFLFRACAAATFRARYEIRTWCGCSAPLFTALHGQKRFNRQHLVRPDTELCIEGFPRSANSYAVLRLASAQKRPLRISHHLHVPAQVQRAVRWNIPTLVLVRHPRDAVASLLIRHPELAIGQTLRAYTKFYRAILPLRDNFVLGNFEEIINDLGPVVTAINDRFGTTLIPPAPEAGTDARIFRTLEQINRSQGSAHGEHAVSRPSFERGARKCELLRRLSVGRPARLLATAEAIYERTIAQGNAHWNSRAA